MICTFCEEEPALLQLRYKRDMHRKQVHVCKVCYELYEDAILYMFPFVDKVKTFQIKTEAYTLENCLWIQNKNQIGKKAKTQKQLVTGDGRHLVHSFLSPVSKRSNVIGRDIQIEQTILALKRKEKNAPLLVGYPGTGKTTVAEAVAGTLQAGVWKIQEKTPEVWMLKIENLLKGTGARGQLEERISALLAFLKTHPYIILFIDEIHMLWSQKGDLANYLKPSLARGEIKVIGATTYREYKDVLRDAAFERRMQVVHIPEPNEEETYLMLQEGAAEYEKHHNVSYTKEALRSCVRLAARYLPNRYFPDKAIDLLDMAGASYQGKKIFRRHVEEIAQKMFRGINLKTWGETVKALEKQLLLEGAGEGSANDVRDVLYVNGIVRKLRKPFCSFLYKGDEVHVRRVAKCISRAAYGSEDVKSIDLREYTEAHSVSKLVGAPPGYVGYQNGGLLTNLLQTQPSQVLLFLHWEEAHGDVQGLIRKIITEGSLHDQEGNLLVFHNTIVIVMERKKTASVGFSSLQEKEYNKGFEAVITLQDKERSELLFALEEMREKWKNAGVMVMWSQSFEADWGKRGFVPKEDWNRQIAEGYIHNLGARIVFLWMKDGNMQDRWGETEEDVCAGNVG